MGKAVIKEVVNSNYCGIVCTIEHLVDLPNCDNLRHAIIFGNKVIVTKDVEAGTKGIFFPVGTQMDNAFLFKNNMYSKAEMNEDTNVKGYFGKNGLVRCVKLRGNESEGLFVGMETIKWFMRPEDEELEIGVQFDNINGHEICRKYVVKHQQSSNGFRESKSNRKLKRISRLVDNQFRFHIDTQMLYRNLSKIHRDDLISVTYKIHGTSGISSYILCNRTNLSWFEKLQKKLFNKTFVDYDYVYASRKVVKNEFAYEDRERHDFYGENIWEIANEELKPFLKKGMTFYYEIAGYLKDGGCIQKGYPYGCQPNEHKIYIYRITYTNVDGQVFEFSMKQVQDFCKEYGLNAVPLLFYGTAEQYIDKHYPDHIGGVCHDMTEIEFEEAFLQFLKDDYNEKDCYICQNGEPEEGCVVRKEINGIESYKVKSTRFYEKETKELEAGESNIEDEN